MNAFPLWFTEQVNWKRIVAFPINKKVYVTFVSHILLKCVSVIIPTRWTWRQRGWWLITVCRVLCTTVCRVVGQYREYLLPPSQRSHQDNGDVDDNDDGWHGYDQLFQMLEQSRLNQPDWNIITVKIAPYWNNCIMHAFIFLYCSLDPNASKCFLLLIS